MGGISVAEEQLAVALALGAERVFCLAPGINPDVLAIQHAAERSGARFQVISSPAGMLGQLTATDELVALADGLFASIEEAQGLLANGPVVLVQPADAGIEAGFERIDANLAAGGAIRIPGRLIERLAGLPTDYDLFSALLRIALQAGLPQQKLPPPGQSKGFWTLVRSEAEAHTIEPAWIRSRTALVLPFNPSRGFAQLLARAFGPALLHAGSGARFVATGAGLLALLAFGSGWFGFSGTGLVLAGLGWVMAESAAVLARIELRASTASAKGLSWQAAYGWIADGLLVALLAWANPPHPWQPEHDRFFPPLMLLALCRLLPRAIGKGWTAWLQDRALIALVTGCAHLAGVLDQAVHWGAAGIALIGLIWPRSGSRLTPP